MGKLEICGDLLLDLYESDIEEDLDELAAAFHMGDVDMFITIYQDITGSDDGDMPADIWYDG